MHNNIFSSQQDLLLPLVKEFSNDFGLIGGTAIALHIGHRRSIDFDLITFSQLQSDKIRNTIRKNHKINNILVNETNELTLAVDEVKFTFLHYPFVINLTDNFQDIIKTPDLLSLAAMKAFALGKRAKWKDYVDLYFIFQKCNLQQLTIAANKIFKSEFNEKLFREQLAYFKDIDYSEKIDYISGFETDDAKIKNFLTDISVQK